MGSTKIVPCAGGCGKTVEVGKFAANTQYCEDCGGSEDTNTKSIECAGGCGKFLKVGLYSSNIQYCEDCKSDENPNVSEQKVRDFKQEAMDRISTSVALVEAKVQRILHDIKSNGNSQLTNIEILTREEIYIYLIGAKKFSVTNNGHLIKEYEPHHKISPAFHFGELKGFYFFTIDSEKQDSNSLIYQRSKYYGLPRTIRNDLDDFVRCTGMFIKDDNNE